MLKGGLLLILKLKHTAVIFLLILLHKTSFFFFFSFVCNADDGISPERVAQVMGQLDHCHHAVHIINELVQTAQVCF